MIDKNIWCTNVQNYYVFKDQDNAEKKLVEIKTFNIKSILNSGSLVYSWAQSQQQTYDF